MRLFCIFFLLILISGISQAQIVSIPDANFKAKLLNHDPVIDTNGDGDIQINEAESFDDTLFLNNNLDTSDSDKIVNILGVEAFTNIVGINISNNLIEAINFSANTSLQTIDISNNVLISLNVTSNTSLSDLTCWGNRLTELNVENNNQLELLNCSNNELSTLNIDNNELLISLTVSENSLTSIDVTKNVLLESLNCYANKLSFLDVSKNIALTTLSCTNNQLTSIDVTNNELLEVLSCGGNGGVSNLEIANLNISENLLLRRLAFFSNEVESLDLKKNTLLESLNFSGKKLQDLDLSQNTFLNKLILVRTKLNEIDLSKNKGLKTVIINSTPLLSLDLSSVPGVILFGMSENYNLKNINLKNRDPNTLTNRILINKCPNLETVCVDDIGFAIDNYRSGVVSNAIFVQDCSIKDVNYNIIQGKLSLDENANGCDITDSSIPNVLVKISDGVNQFATLTNSNGTYSIPLLENTYQTKLEELSANTNVTLIPEFYTDTFTGFGNTETADFCATFNQSLKDLNVRIIPVFEARPGFDSRYQLVYENLGLTVNSGSITLTFDDAKQKLVNATPSEDLSSSNSLTFSFINLKPFEKRVIDITMNTFTPPTVNGDDVLSFQASITPSVSDVSPEDNIYNLEQIVVNSFDPNDKEVLQGSEIGIDETGEYLDYIIRFQNTGTASAVNVAITDELNSKLDWNTIKMISSSHDYRTRITNGNFVEFLFDNIHLPAEQDNEAASHGFVAFKIKPKTDVVIGDIITGIANIYFDFNASIITNTVSTEVLDNTLSVKRINKLKESVKLYPNPTTTKFSIKISNGTTINKVSLYSVSGKQLFETTKNLDFYDLTNFKGGVYFVKVETNKGLMHRRIIKK